MSKIKMPLSFDDALKLSSWLGILRTYALVNEVWEFDFACLDAMREVLHSEIDHNICSCCQTAQTFRGSLCRRCYTKRPVYK